MKALSLLLIPLVSTFVFVQAGLAQVRLDCHRKFFVADESGTSSKEIFPEDTTCSVSMRYVNQTSGKESNRDISCYGASAKGHCSADINGFYEPKEDPWKPHTITPLQTWASVGGKIYLCKATDTKLQLNEHVPGDQAPSIALAPGGRFWRQYVRYYPDAVLQNYNLSWEKMCQNYGYEYCPPEYGFTIELNQSLNCRIPTEWNDAPAE